MADRSGTKVGSAAWRILRQHHPQQLVHKPLAATSTSLVGVFATSPATHQAPQQRFQTLRILAVCNPGCCNSLMRACIALLRTTAYRANERLPRRSLTCASMSRYTGRHVLIFNEAHKAATLQSTWYFLRLSRTRPMRHGKNWISRRRWHLRISALLNRRDRLLRLRGHLHGRAPSSLVSGSLNSRKLG